MARLNQTKDLSQRDRQFRYFSTELKQKLVRDLEKNLITKAEISREYHVSRSAIDKWVYKYSVLMKKGIKMVIESKSDTKKIIELKSRLKELEQLVGQKQITIEFLEKMIALASEEFGTDIKKKWKK
jgi:transposase-like protein